MLPTTDPHSVRAHAPTHPHACMHARVLLNVFFWLGLALATCALFRSFSAAADAATDAATSYAVGVALISLSAFFWLMTTGQVRY